MKMRARFRMTSLVSLSVLAILLGDGSVACGGRAADETTAATPPPPPSTAPSAPASVVPPTPEPSPVPRRSWERRASLPLPRTEHAVVALGGKLYAIGGSTGSDMLARVDVYDPATDTWTRRADLHTARRDFAAAAIDGKIHVAGGMSFSSKGDVTYVRTTEIYDPIIDTWTEVADAPIGPAVNAVWGNLFVGGGGYGGRLLLLGYRVNNGDEPLEFSTSYDATKNAWEVDVPAAPWRSAQLDAVTLSGNLFVAASGFYSFFGTELWAWNAASGEWVKRQGLSSIGRASHAAANGMIFAAGGINGDMSRSEVCPLVAAYDPKTDSWAERPNLAVPRAYAGAAEVDGVLYVVGGDDQRGVVSSAVEALRL